MKDQGLRALLRRFAATPPDAAHGLVVLTSRLAVKDIAHWQDGAAPVVDVDRLSDEAGAALLRDNGVWGTDKELKAAVRDFEGHPLALGLLASFLKETQLGDVRRRDHIRALMHDEDNPRHDHARRVMESYEKEWLAGEPVLLAIMHMIGLFDRPASGDCLNALRAPPVIEGLTDQIVKLNEGQWQRAVTRLREVRLLAPRDPAARGALDAHPLVREWLGERLRQGNQAAWKAAHSRIYEHLRDTTKEGKAPTLEVLAPLYQAIPHGCRAGRHREALDRIYVDRICRRYPNKHIAYYARDKLGAFGSDLAVISWFFERPYDIPMSTLPLQIRTWLLSDAGATLWARGRFAEALPAMRASFEMSARENQWWEAAVCLSNLNQAELQVGEVATALSLAQQSVDCARRGVRQIQVILNLTSHAAALHAAGRRDEAKNLFAEAERLQAEGIRNDPTLRSLQGYYYCDLLLDGGDWASARDRVLTYPGVRPLDVAVNHLNLGRAHLGLALTSLRPPADEARARNEARAAPVHFDGAVEKLRVFDNIPLIPCGLLARAAFLRSLGDWNGAERDLGEVKEIADTEPLPMRLFLCDMALERARLAFARIEAFAPLNGLLDKDSPEKPAVPSPEKIAELKAEAEKQLAIAADYIATCGYHRRDEELAELQAVHRGERPFATLPPRV